jgi:hypothetical protein
MNSNVLYRSSIFVAIFLTVILGVSSCKSSQIQIAERTSSSAHLPDYFERKYKEKENGIGDGENHEINYWKLEISKDLVDIKMVKTQSNKDDIVSINGKSKGRKAILSNNNGDSVRVKWKRNNTVKVKGRVEREKINKTFDLLIDMGSASSKGYFREFAKTVLVNNENEKHYRFTQKDYIFHGVMVETHNNKVDQRLNQSIMKSLLIDFKVDNFDAFAKEYHKEYTASGGIERMLDRDYLYEVISDIVYNKNNLLSMVIGYSSYKKKSILINSDLRIYNYDLLTGLRVDWDKLLTEEDKEVLLRLFRKVMKDNNYDVESFNISMFNEFLYISDEGVNLYVLKEEVMPMVFCVEWEDIVDVLKNSALSVYFP